MISSGMSSHKYIRAKIVRKDMMKKLRILMSLLGGQIVLAGVNSRGPTITNGGN